MIYEREVHLPKRYFDNDDYFPNILLIRKMKDNQY